MRKKKLLLTIFALLVMLFAGRAIPAGSAGNTDIDKLLTDKLKADRGLQQKAYKAATGQNLPDYLEASDVKFKGTVKYIKTDFDTKTKKPLATLMVGDDSAVKNCKASGSTEEAMSLNISKENTYSLHKEASLTGSYRQAYTVGAEVEVDIPAVSSAKGTASTEHEFTVEASAGISDDKGTSEGIAFSKSYSVSVPPEHAQLDERQIKRLDYDKIPYTTHWQLAGDMEVSFSPKGGDYTIQGVSLKSNIKGQCLGAEKDWDKWKFTSRTNCSPQNFTLKDINGGVLKSGDEVFIKHEKGALYSWGKTDKLRPQDCSDCRLVVVKADGLSEVQGEINSGDKIGLKIVGGNGAGYYIGSHWGGGGDLKADEKSMQGDEQFIIYWPGGRTTSGGTYTVGTGLVLSGADTEVTTKGELQATEWILESDSNSYEFNLNEDKEFFKDVCCCEYAAKYNNGDTSICYDPETKINECDERKNRFRSGASASSGARTSGKPGGAAAEAEHGELTENETASLRNRLGLKTPEEGAASGGDKKTKRKR